MSDDGIQSLSSEHRLVGLPPRRRRGTKHLGRGIPPESQRRYRRKTRVSASRTSTILSCHFGADYEKESVKPNIILNRIDSRHHRPLDHRFGDPQYVQRPTFAEVIDAVDKLSPDEQETLIETIRRRLAQRRRQELLADIDEARADLAAGRSQVKAPQEIVDETRP